MILYLAALELKEYAEEIKKIFPTNENHIIFSSDTMNKKNSLEILEKIVSNKISNFNWNSVNF